MLALRRRINNVYTWCGASPCSWPASSAGDHWQAAPAAPCRGRELTPGHRCRQFPPWPPWPPAAPAAGQHRARAITGKPHQRPPTGAASSPRATAAASSPHGHRGPLQRLQLASIERGRSPASRTSGPLPGPRAHPGPPLPPVPPMATVAPCSACSWPASSAGDHRQAGHLLIVPDKKCRQLGGIFKNEYSSCWLQPV